MSNTSVALVDMVTGAKASLQVNEKLMVGDKFRLLGRSVTFEAATIRGVLGGETTVVDGVSECGRFQTTARVCDTANPL